MKRTFLLSTFIITLLILSGTVSGKEVLDEQFGPGGAKVELVKAKIRNNVLTLAVRYIHPVEFNSNPEMKLRTRTIPIKFKVSSVFYIADGKRYFVLKDRDGNWLASPVVGDYIAEPVDMQTLKKEMKKNKLPALILEEAHPVKILWFKFPAPPEGVDGIEFQIPEVSPFDVEIKR